MNNFVHSNIDLSETFSFPLIAENEVLKLIGSLDENRTIGMDGVSPGLLTMAAPVLAEPITKIFNLSICTGTFPTKWKMGRVTPINESGNRSDQNNFRPITILKYRSKSLERHIHNALYTFFLKNSRLYLAQSRFHALYFCETALTRLVDMWTANMEKCLLNSIVLLDLRKAFDLVDTYVLL